YSIQYDVLVSRLILGRLPLTLPLMLMAATLMLLTALPLGLYAATRHRRAGDYAAMVLSQVGIAVPSFWAGLLLILLFSVRPGWVQSGGSAGWPGGDCSGEPWLLRSRSCTRRRTRSRCPSRRGSGRRRPRIRSAPTSTGATCCRA